MPCPKSRSSTWLLNMRDRTHKTDYLARQSFLWFLGLGHRSLDPALTSNPIDFPHVSIK